MKMSFREDIDRAHRHGVFCMPKAHADSKPFFSLDVPRAGGHLLGKPGTHGQPGIQTLAAPFLT